jgi:SAM-dependent methyltransferase
VGCNTLAYYHSCFTHRASHDSENFIAAAKRIQSGASLTFRASIEGDISEEVSLVLEPGVDSNVMSRVHFWQGDACALSNYAEDQDGFGTFDGVILANLLCRLPDPRACINALPRIVNKGGVVVIVTPFSWSEGGSMTSSPSKFEAELTEFLFVRFLIYNRLHSEE